MNIKTTVFAALAAIAGAAGAADPTVAEDAMADHLGSRAAVSPALALKALVVGADGDGVALLGAADDAGRVVRRGGVLTESVDGVRVAIAIKSVSEKGVELSAGTGGKSISSMVRSRLSILPPRLHRSSSAIWNVPPSVWTFFSGLSATRLASIYPFRPRRPLGRFRFSCAM